MKLRFLSFILLAGVVTNSVAQLTLTLNTNTLAGEPGQVLSFNGTLRNESGSEIFLNGISISLGGIDLTPDESPFFLNFPISLAASQQASGVLFTVAIANTAPEQTVSGDLTVSGGTNAATLDLLTNATFQVQVLPKPGPEIVVEHPVGTGLADGLATVNFGGAPVGGSSQRTITIGNHGASNLTGLSITIDGANAGDFTVTANPTVPVVPNGSTTFTVTFAPGGTCARAAALHITSNDGDESPFDIALTGLGTETNPPSINCAANILAAVDPGQSSRSNVTYSVTFGDDCPGAILTQTAGLPSGATFPVGTTTNRFIATDTSGNTNTCSFTVTIFYNPGALQVTINPPGAVSAGAQWQLDGGAYQNSGTVVTNLSAGNHTVSFSTVAGWITPGNQIVAVGSDTTNTVSGNYIAQGTLIWINPAGGNWNNPNNWNPNQVPGPADTAVLTQAVTVTVNVPVTVRNVTLANTTLAASSGLIVTGTMDWTSGILNGTATIAAGAVLNIVTANVHDMYNCTFTNHGTVVWSDGLVRGGHNPGTFIHNFGLWDAQNDLTLNNAYAGVGTVFNNAGIYRKSGGASTNTITDGVTFNNTGLLEVMTGSLALHGNGSFTGGTTTNAGGLIQLAAGTYLINGTTTTTNVQLIGGTLGNGTVLRGELTWVQGVLASAGFGAVVTVTVASNSVLHIVTGNVHDLLFCRLTNYGTVAWSDGLVRGGHNPGTFIYNFGLWDAQNDLTLNNAYGGAGTVFNNAGIYRKSGGASTNTITDGVTFNNNGLLEVLTGLLSLQGGGSFTGGTTTNAGGLIQLAAATYLINGTTTTTNVQLIGGTLGNGTVLRGELTWVQGVLASAGFGAVVTVTVASNSVLHIVTGNVHDLLFCRLTNYGTVAWSDGLVRGGHNPGTFIYNFGLWDAQNDLTLNNAYAGAGTAFNNAGIYRKSGGASTNTITDGVTFNNTGTLDIKVGTVNLAGTYTLAGGTLSLRLNSLTDFGKLTLAGSAALAGPLNASLSGAFIPAVGHQFKIVSCSGVSGTFSPLNVPAGTSVNYSNSGVFLIVTNLAVQLLPPQLAGANFNFSFPTANGQNYTVQCNDDLNTTNWVLHTNFIGDGLPAQIFVPPAGVPQRYFRVWGQ